MAKKNRMSKEEFLQSMNNPVEANIEDSSNIAVNLESSSNYDSSDLNTKDDTSYEWIETEENEVENESFASNLDKFDWDSEATREVTEHNYMGDESFIESLTESEVERKEKKEKQAAFKLDISRKDNNGNFTIGTLTEENYGELLPFIKDTNVTDINWNGEDLWIDDIEKGRYKVDIKLSPEFVKVFSIRVSNIVSRQFNKYTPVLEAEAESLRITVMHESVSQTGTAISIRKTPAIRRITFDSAVKNGNFVTETVSNLISNSVKAGMNIIVCGLPGAGKTEFVKFLTNYIFPRDRAITIEDTLELHYSKINPGKDCIEFKVNNTSFDYTQAIKSCLRLLPKWILLSEARSKEVQYLLESVSTGTKCLTTLHTDDVTKIPSRVVNMIGEQSNQEEITNSVYEFFNMGILIDKTIGENGIERFVSQLCFFTRENGENKCVMVVDDRELVNTELPKEIMRAFKRIGITNPFEYKFIPA